MHHGQPYDAWIAYRWVLTWILVCGLPIALSMALPAWIPMDDANAPADGHH